MAVAKRKRREKPRDLEQKKIPGPGWGPQVKQIALLASPVYIGQSRGRRKNMQIEEPKLIQGLLFSSYLLGWPTLMPWGCIFLCLPIKLSYNSGLSVAWNFCCSESERRKLQTPRQFFLLELRTNLFWTIPLAENKYKNWTETTDE